MPAHCQSTHLHFLRDHVNHTLGFYERHAYDPRGGFFHHLLDDGRVQDAGFKHLVSATRHVFNWSMAWRHSGQIRHQDWARHALAHLAVFRRPDGLYAWTVQDGRIQDPTVMAYGQAFVLLAQAHALAAGVGSVQAVAEAFDQMEAAFYRPADRAYADEITPEGVLLPYRGQNANMHMCEACLAAHAFTGDARYLARAVQLIERFAFELAETSDGLIWEHYTEDWRIDWDYNRHSPGNIFKPWGFQTGHQTEWAKLLLMAHAQQPEPRWLAKAETLQQAAWRHGLDPLHGGLVYGFGPDRRICDSDKYFWVLAESLASAWRLWRLTGQVVYLEQYRHLWDWSWQHLVDHRHGAWFRVASAEGRVRDESKSPPGKVDYHTLGACWDVMAVGGLDD